MWTHMKSLKCMNNLVRVRGEKCTLVRMVVTKSKQGNHFSRLLTATGRRPSLISPIELELEF